MVDSANLHQRITAFFLEKLQIEAPSKDADLIDSGLLDSLAFVELLVYIEQEFRISISLDDLEFDHFRSIATVAEFISTLS